MIEQPFISVSIIIEDLKSLIYQFFIIGICCKSQLFFDKEEEKFITWFIVTNSSYKIGLMPYLFLILNILQCLPCQHSLEYNDSISSDGSEPLLAQSYRALEYTNSISADV